MPERSAVLQGVQIGVEVTEGVAVAANRRLASIDFTLTPEADTTEFRTKGIKGLSLVTLNKEWSEAELEGVGTYNEIVYVLSSLVDAGALTTPAGATNAREWEFVMDADAPDSPVTFTVQQGDANFAEAASGVKVNELEMTINMDGGVEIGGSAFGREIDIAATMTATPTMVTLVPMMGNQFSIYYDPVTATPETDLGTTKLTRVTEAVITISDRFGQLWAIDAAQDSYAATVETEPTLEVELTMQADAAGMAFVTALRNGEVGMLRIEGVGAEIDDGIAASAYRMTFDAAVSVSDVGDVEDNDGAMTIGVTLAMVYQAVWNKVFRFQVVNAMTAL